MPLSGNDIIEECQLRLQESLSTSAMQQSMLYPDHVRRSADELARELKVIYATAAIDLINLVSVYPTPKRPFQSVSVRVADSGGNTYPVAGITSDQADAQYPNWQVLPPNVPCYQGIPIIYVDDGGDRISLIPAPNYNAQMGLQISGYFGVDEWWNMADPNPLPEGYDEAIVLGACIRRCDEMITIDPGYQLRLPRLEQKYKELWGRLYRERIGQSEASRNSIPSRGKQLGGWLGWGLYGGAGW